MSSKKHRHKLKKNYLARKVVWSGDNKSNMYKSLNDIALAAYNVTNTLSELTKLFNERRSNKI